MSGTLSSVRCMILSNRFRSQESVKVVKTCKKEQSLVNPHPPHHRTLPTVKPQTAQTVAANESKPSPSNTCFCDQISIRFHKGTQTFSWEFEEFAEKGDNIISSQHNMLQPFQVFIGRLLEFFRRPIFVILTIIVMVVMSFPFWKRYLFKVSAGRFADFYCLVGLLVTLRFVSNCVHVVWSKCVANDDIFKKAGSWAVVTGCTNGIGKEYALQLAAKGLNVALISRNPKLLEDLAFNIGNTYGVRTMVIVMDFTAGDSAKYNWLAKQLHGYDIGVLVNNVGISSDPILFHEMTSQFTTDLINVNMFSLAKMCEIVLPGMAVRRRGIIINLSSALGTHPVSFVSLYGASKRFVDMFSRSIEKEYSQSGITVQSVTPYFISTNMTKGVDTEFFIPDAKTFVSNALATVGRHKRTYGYWRHAVQGALMRNLPDQVMYFLMKVMKYRSEKLDADRKAGQ